MRRYSNIPICLDTQGAQVRCGSIADGVSVARGERVELVAAAVEGTRERLTLWPASVFVGLRRGDQVEVDFDGDRMLSRAPISRLAS